MNRKEKEEQWIFETFVKLYNKGTITVVKRQESPDFVIELDGKTIGIELTEIFQDSINGHSKLQQKSSDWETFTKQFIDAIQPFINFHFGVGIDFNEFFPIRKNVRKALIKELVQTCLPKLSYLQNHDHLYFDYYMELPEQIDSITFFRFDESDCSFNFKPEGGTVATLTSEHLIPILNKKEEKLKKYFGCQEYWLVIREGNYHAGSFSDDFSEISINTSFDKVFIVRTSRNKLMILK